MAAASRPPPPGRRHPHETNCGFAGYHVSAKSKGAAEASTRPVAGARSGRPLPQGQGIVRQTHHTEDEEKTAATEKACHSQQDEEAETGQRDEEKTAATERAFHSQQDEEAETGQRDEERTVVPYRTIDNALATAEIGESDRVQKDQILRKEEAAYSIKASGEAIKLLNPLRAQVEVEICLLRAFNLAISKGTTSCNPFVKVKAIDEHNNVEDIGQFSVKSCTMDPRWDEESVNVVVPLADTGTGEFRVHLEVLNYEKRTSEHLPLGQVTITKHELLMPRLTTFSKQLQVHDSLNIPDSKKAKGGIELRLHLYGRVIVTIDKARQLRNADGSFGTSDPFAVCNWVGHKARRLARTPTAKNSLNPIWNHPLVVLIPLLRPLHGGHLTIDVFDDDWIGRDDFLGRATMNGDFMLRRRAQTPLQLPLNGRHPHERAQGSVEVRVFVHETLYSFVRDLIHDVSHRIKTLNDIPRVHCSITILRATSLHRTDCFGLVSGDPYAVLYSDGQKVGRTPTRSKSTNPVWDKGNTFKLRNVPSKFVNAKNDGTDLPLHGSIQDSADGAGEEVEFETRRKYGSWSSLEPGSQGHSEKSLNSNETDQPETPHPPPEGGSSGQINLQSAEENKFDKVSVASSIDYTDKILPCERGEKVVVTQQTELTLAEDNVMAVAYSEAQPHEQIAACREPTVDVRIDLFDDDSVSSTFLGSATVTWRHLLTPGEHEIVLVDSSSRRKVKQKPHETRGTLTIHIQLEAVVAVAINEGVGLAQNDPYDKSDPYAIAKWDTKSVSKTAVRYDNLDPKWYGQRFELAVPIPAKEQLSQFESRNWSNDGTGDQLIIEVWEKNKWTKDRCMGVVYIRSDELLHPSPGLPRFLTRRPGKSEDPAPQGYLELDIHASLIPHGILAAMPAKKIEFRLEGQNCLDDQPEIEVCLRILRAGGLVQQDIFGGGDPCVHIRLNDKLIGKTDTRSNTLRPEWTNEVFYFNLLLNAKGDAAKGDTEVRLEVWNADFATKQFMGVARIGPEQLLTRHGITRYALLPEKPSAKFLAAPDHVDPGLGWIEVDIKLAAPAILDIIRADGLRAADASGTSDPYVVVRWVGHDDRTVARSAAEKRTLSPNWFFTVPLSIPMTRPAGLFAALILEVWDHDRIGSHDFLGLCVMDSHEILSVAAKEPTATQSYRLLNRDKRGRDKKEAQGTITWKVKVQQQVLKFHRRLFEVMTQQKTSNILDGTHVKFEVMRGVHLPNRDGLFGTSDPYIKAYANGKLIGSTSVISSSLNPVWPCDGSEAYTIKNFPTFGDLLTNERFMVRLAIFDSDLGRDDFMGEAALTWDLLTTAGTHNLQVKGRIFDPDRAGTKAVEMRKNMEAYARRVGFSRKGQSETDAQDGMKRRRSKQKKGTRVEDVASPGLARKRWWRNSIVKQTPQLIVRVWHVARVRLHLTSAHDLRAADTGILKPGKSDPYATVRYCSKTIAKTRVRKNTLNPIWCECFEFEVPTFEPKEGTEPSILIEIFDHDIAGSDDFLGCVAISQDILLRPHYGDVFELGPRPNAGVNDPMPSGFVDVKIETSYIPTSLQPVQWPRAPLLQQAAPSPVEDEERIYDQNWAQRDIRSAVDKEAGKRFWYEKINGAQMSSCSRWWYDPRPLPPKPNTVFSIPLPAPKSSSTKRKYANFNEPRPGEPEYSVRPTAIVEVNVLSASGLKKSDRIGKSDPYATVRFGPIHALKTVGRTRIVNNSLNPVWGDSPIRYTVPLDSECDEQNLVIEIWDSDNHILGYRDDALGMCTIQPEVYLNADAPIRRILRPQPGESPVTGWVEVRVSILGRVKVTLKDVEYRPSEKLGEKNVSEIKRNLVFAPVVMGWKELQCKREKLPGINTPRPSAPHEGNVDTVDVQDGRASQIAAGFDVDVPLQRAGTMLVIDVMEATLRNYRTVGVATITGEDLLMHSGCTDRVIDVAASGTTESSSSTFLTGIRVCINCSDAVHKLAKAKRAARELQESCNTLPQLAAIEVNILRATNLKQADVMSLSDPYVAGWFCGSQVGQTRVRSNTLNPNWEGDSSATFRVSNVRTVDDDVPVNLGGAPKISTANLGILLEVWDSDGPGRRGDFLGHAILRHEDLMSAGEKELELRDRKSFVGEAYVAHHGIEPRRRTCIRRLCKVCCTPCCAVARIVTFPVVLLCSAATRAFRTFFDGCVRGSVKGKLLVRVGHHALVKLRILEGYALPPRDASSVDGKGTSNPYCLVEYRGKEIAKTKVHANNNDPCFYEEFDISIPVPATGSSKTTSYGTGSAELTLPWDHPGRAFQPANDDAILIIVYSSHAMTADSFLGQVVVRPEFLLRPQNGTHWPLETRKPLSSYQNCGYLELHARTSRIPGSLEPTLLRQHGVLGVYREAIDHQTGRRYYFDVWTLERFWINPAEAVALTTGIEFDARGRPKSPDVTFDPRRQNPSDIDTKPEHISPLLTHDANNHQAVISVLIARASNLTAADVTGYSDPYAIVKLGDCSVGKTSVKRRTLNPEWMEVVPIVVTIGQKFQAANVSIEIYDHDLLGSDDFLGVANFNTGILLDNTDQVLTMSLNGKPGGSPVTGVVVVHVSVALKVVLEILSAEYTTSRQNGIKRGCYCVASWRGRQHDVVTRTTTVYDERHFRWNHSVAFAVPLRFPHDRFRLEIREHSQFGADKFVGKVEIDASRFLAETPRNKHSGDISIQRFTLDNSEVPGIPDARRDSRCYRRVQADLNVLDVDSMIADLAAPGSAEDNICDDVPFKCYPGARFAGKNDTEVANAAPQTSSKAVPHNISLFLRVKICISRMWKRCSEKFSFDIATKTVDSTHKQPEFTLGRQAEHADELNSQTSALAKERREEKAAPVVCTVDSAYEVGDVLSIRILSSSTASDWYATAHAAWRQRPSANVLPKTYAKIEILCANSLRHADYVGKSDPYVEVHSGGVRVGRTKTIQRTLNPKWIDETFLLALFPHRAESRTHGFDSRVELRVMDEDTFTKSDLLGSVRLDHSDLLGNSKWLTRPLTHDIENLEKVTNKPVATSHGENAIGQLGSLTFRTQVVLQVRLLVIGAYNLALNSSVLDRTPDPYAVVMYREKIMGNHTAVRSNTCRPLWYHSVELQVPVPSDGVYGDPVLLIVYDKNTMTQDTVIGTVTIPHENLVYPHDHPGTLPISAPDSSCNITGWMEIHIEASHVPGHVEPRRRPGELPVYIQAVDPRNDRPYWFDACTGEQFWDDPRPAAETYAKHMAARAKSVDRSDDRFIPPITFVRARQGFPEAPNEVAAMGQATAAKVWWTLPRENGPSVFGYTVERQRCFEKQHGQTEWRDTGAAAAQAKADEEAARVSGKQYVREMRRPPTSILVDQLAEGAKYRFRVYSHNDVGRSTPSEWSNEVLVAKPLPEGWVEVVSAEGRPFFYNAKTQQSSWERPEQDEFYLPTHLRLRFTEDEITHLQAVYTSCDVDQSQAISLREFQACMPELGEYLSASDSLWLVYQADLDSKAELNFTNFVKAIDTLKRARSERAPPLRKALAKLYAAIDNLTRPRIGRAGKSLISSKDQEIKERFGAWRQREHLEAPGLRYWFNVETGQACYEMPREIRFYVPDSLRDEASMFLSPDRLNSLEAQFEAMDLDGSGAIDAYELKLLVERVTSRTLSDDCIRALIREVDVDRSGEVDFDEFVLILVTLQKGKSGLEKWARLLDPIDKRRIDSLKKSADNIRRGDESRNRRKAHGHYCVCGCRRLTQEQRRKAANRMWSKNLFPKLRESQLRKRAGGGEAAALAAYNDTKNLVFDKPTYHAAVLVAPQSRIKSSDFPRWSLLQTRREARARNLATKTKFQKPETMLS